MSEPLVIMNMIKYNIQNKNNWYYGFDTKIFVKIFVISWICSWFRENYEDMHWSIQKEVRLLTISPHCIETYRRHPKGENVHWECSRIPDSVREFVIWFVISWKYSWFVCGAQKGVWSSTILPQSIMNVSNVLRGVRLYIDTPAITLMFQIQFMNSGFHEIFVISWKFWGCPQEHPERRQAAHYRVSI